MGDDETQQSPTERTSGRRLRAPAWMRWFSRGAATARGAQRASDRLSVHETLRALPTLLDGAGLPDGVVELLIEDLETSTRQLFDIHDGHVKLVEPGECVPWASIAGPAAAWALALGPERRTTQLQLTGDEQLARRVLAALPRQP